MFAVFLPVFFASCNDPLEKTYSPATYLQDISEMRESDKVNYEDIELLTKFIALSKFAGNELEGKTYEEILEKIKEVRNANDQQNNQAEMEREAARDRMGAYLKIHLSGKDFKKINNKDCFIYTVNFQNTSTKNISMVIGSISLNDLIDREIKNIQIVLDEQLKPGSTLNKSYTVVYTHGDENDQHIRSKELVDLRVLWNPVKIVFEDGTMAE